MSTTPNPEPKVQNQSGSDRDSPDGGMRRGSRQSGAMKSFVQAEKLMQIAFILPCSLVVGWAIGYGIDAWLHIHWAVVAGVILGIVAGMISVIRTAIGAMQPPSRRGPDRSSSPDRSSK